MPPLMDDSIKPSPRPHILKHILLSNTLILLLSIFAAYYMPLFSNQLHLAYYNYNLPLLSPTRLSTDISQYHQYTGYAHNNNTKYQITRFSLSFLKMGGKSQDVNFDGLQFYKNKYQYQPNFAFIKGYVRVIAAVKYVVGLVKSNWGLDGDDLVEGSIYTTTTIVQTNQLIELVILILINKLLFSLTAYKVYTITLHLTSTSSNTPHTIAHSTTLIYLYNPACVFFHSVYTESIYIFLTFTSIDYLLKSQQKKNNMDSNKQQMLLLGSEVNGDYVKAVGWLWLAVFFRTNSVFLSTIFGVPIIYQLWQHIKRKHITKIITTLIKGAFILAIILSPLISYQSYIYRQLCRSQIDLIHDQNLLLECSKLLPNLYSFIQRKFWSVGFFSYWKLSNAVFILLGLPALVVGSSIFRQIFKLCKRQLHKVISSLQLIKLGLYLSFLILFMVTLALTNIQSSTRFFSTHIIFYILIYEWLPSKLVTFWIFLYFSFGAVLFFIGFPWT